MKVKVLKVFKDKHNGKIYKVDEEINMTKKRYNEILETGKLVEEIKETKEKADENAEA